MQLDQQYIDPLDKQLLNDIQWTFPLSERPYLKIAAKHGLSEEDEKNFSNETKWSDKTD